MPPRRPSSPARQPPAAPVRTLDLIRQEHSQLCLNVGARMAQIAALNRLNAGDLNAVEKLEREAALLSPPPGGA